MKNTDSDYARCKPSSCTPGRCACLVRALALKLRSDAVATRRMADGSPSGMIDQFSYGRASALDDASTLCFELLDQLEGRKPTPEPPKAVHSCCPCVACCCPIPSDVRFTVAGEPQKSEPDPIVLETMEGQTWEIAAALAQLGENRPTEFAITKTVRNGDAEESIEVRCNYGD